MAEPPPPLPPEFLRTPLAHRGLHGLTPGVVENSRAAFREACDAGYGIELDLQLSRDGEAMVFHDYVLERMTDGSGLVNEVDAAELGQIMFSGTDETIPRLSEVLDLVAGRAPLLIEMKDQDGALGPDVGPLESRVAEILASYRGPVICMSFNPHSMAELRRHAPEMVLGLATGPLDNEFWSRVPGARLDELRGIPDIARIGAGFVSHKFIDLGARPVALLKASGLPVLSWTIKSLAQEKIARRIADNITFEGYLPNL